MRESVYHPHCVIAALVCGTLPSPSPDCGAPTASAWVSGLGAPSLDSLWDWDPPDVAHCRHHEIRRVRQSLVSRWGAFRFGHTGPTGCLGRQGHERTTARLFLSPVAHETGSLSVVALSGRYVYQLLSSV
jgi:hypothetical protein